MSCERGHAILFDMDGVLIDSFEIWVRVLARVAEELGCPEVTREMVQLSWGQSVAADVESFYRGHDAETVTRLYERFLMDYARHVVAIDGACELLESLRKNEFPHAVVTNSPRELAKRLLSGADLEVRILVAGDDVENGKPAPDMLLKACEMLAVPVADAVMVGDTDYDREAAGAAGSGFLGFRLDGANRIDELTLVLDHIWAGN